MFLFKTRRPPQCQGEKTNLRPLRKEDAPAIHAWLDDKELMELAFGLHVDDPNFQRLVPAYRKEIEGNRNSFFAIEDKEGKLIGFCSHTIFHLERRARIGILIGDRNYWNHGYGRDAVLFLLRYLFFERGMSIIELDTAPFNQRAQRCFESCGFLRANREWSEGHGRLWYELKRHDFVSRFGRP